MDTITYYVKLTLTEKFNCVKISIKINKYSYQERWREKGPMKPGNLWKTQRCQFL